MKQKLSHQEPIPTKEQWRIVLERAQKLIDQEDEFALKVALDTEQTFHRPFKEIKTRHWFLLEVASALWKQEAK